MFPQTVGRYEIKSELGRGGMATVYRGYDPRFQREVAVKVLPREFLHDPSFRARFEREAQTIAALEHSAIVPVYDFGEEEGQPYLIMRLMTGGTLAERMGAGLLPLTEVARIFNRIAPALDRAHSKGIVHRDLKPGNILFDDDNNPYVSDFGIAKLTQASAAFTGSAIVGTPAYMSPEQARGEKNIDGRSDIYALGAILFQMLTGKFPYEADTPMGMVVKHITEPPPRILEAKPDLPPECETVIQQAMAKSRDERYSTASGMAKALETIAQDTLVARKPAQLEAETTTIASQPAQAEREQRAHEKAEAERIAALKAEQERLARKKAEDERAARERAQQEPLAREKAEAERIAALKAEEERVAREKAEQERLTREKTEQERLAREEAEHAAQALLPTPGRKPLRKIPFAAWAGMAALGLLIVGVVFFTALGNGNSLFSAARTATPTLTVSPITKPATMTPKPLTPALTASPTVVPSMATPPSPVATPTLSISLAGHGGASTESFRHWDGEGEVPAGCARCHSAMGLATFIENGVNIAVPPATSGFLCANCHDDLTQFTRRTLDKVPFPSGAVLTFGPGEDANLCIACHQGRESTTGVDKAIADIKDDEIRTKDDGQGNQVNVLSFRNIHYFAAGATLFGDAAKGAYEYEGQMYLGQFAHGDLGPTQCVECHNVHTLEVKVDLCQNCHKNVKTVEDLKGVRGPSSDKDYDGDGQVEEGIYGELDPFREKLYAAIQVYAKGKAGAVIVYDAASYPYFFLDANGDGNPDKNDAGAAIGYSNWTPRLLKAAYNYQYSQKDPGAFAHNGRYAIQVLYDSIKDIGGNTSKMTRPDMR